jgi:ribosomal protein L2
MPIQKCKPTSPGRRFVEKVVHSHLHKGAPHAPLVEAKKRTGGRNNQGQGAGMGLRNGTGSGAIFGEVTKIDDTSITIKTVDGGSKIILISDSTAFNKSTSVAKTELKVGSQVRVDGTTDTNTGSVTGKSIEIDPARNGQNQTTTPAPQQ